MSISIVVFLAKSLLAKIIAAGYPNIKQTTVAINDMYNERPITFRYTGSNIAFIWSRVNIIFPEEFSVKA